MSAGTLESEIRRLEADRCQALVNRDLGRLDQLLAGDLLHVHANGAVEDRAAYLAGVTEKLEFLQVERGDLTIRVHADAAIAVGPVQQTVRVRASSQVVSMSLMTTQVWLRRGGVWRQVSYQATKVTPV